jgi:uncharacterized membrane protein
MTYDELMEQIARAFEIVGVTIIVIGGVVALISGFRDFRDLDKYFAFVRRSFGRPLILGLEILVAADIIETITVDPSLESVLVLGVLVLVRTALSFSLDIEVEGMLPWRRVEVETKLRAAGIDPVDME